MVQLEPPERDAFKERDDYAEENDIDYQSAGMTVSGTKWEYYIFSPEDEPTRDYGVIGDVAKHSDSFWYRDHRKWRQVNPALDNIDRPVQKHPLLKGRDRFDCIKGKWRNNSSYYTMRRRREGNDNSNVMRNSVSKEEEEPIRVRRIKGEPIHIDLSRNDDQWSPSDSVGGGKDKRRFYVDLTLEANEPPHRIAFVLPSRSTHSAPRQAVSGPSSSRSAPVTAPTARDRHRDGIPALDDDLDYMYLDPSGEANADPYQMPAPTQEVHTSNHIVIPSKDGSSSSQEKVEPEPGTTMFDPPHGSEKRSRSMKAPEPDPKIPPHDNLLAFLKQEFSQAAEDRAGMSKMMKKQTEELEVQKQQAETQGRQMVEVMKRLDALEAQRFGAAPAST